MKSINEKIDEQLEKIPVIKLPEIEPEYTLDPPLENDIKILFSNDMTGCMDNNMSWGTLDTIQPFDFGNLTIPGYGSSGGSVSLGGSNGASVSYHNPIYTSTNYNWNTATPKVRIGSDGIEMDEGADITVGGRSLTKILDAIEHRLSILVPDPNKLERYEALKQAYEHYRTLEALCAEEPKLEKS